MYPRKSETNRMKGKETKNFSNKFYQRAIPFTSGSGVTMHAWSCAETGDVSPQNQSIGNNHAMLHFLSQFCKPYGFMTLI